METAQLLTQRFVFRIIKFQLCKKHQWRGILQPPLIHPPQLLKRPSPFLSSSFFLSQIQHFFFDSVNSLPHSYTHIPTPSSLDCTTLRPRLPSRQPLDRSSRKRMKKKKEPPKQKARGGARREKKYYTQRRIKR